MRIGRTLLPGVVLTAVAVIGSPAELSGQANPRDEVTTVVYRVADGDSLRADVYPVQGVGPFPAVLWLHGGALIFGNRSWVRPEFAKFARDAGLVLISLDYRLAPETKLPEILDDVRFGLRWAGSEAARRFNISPEHIVVAGNSAGGFLALDLGSQSEPRPAAVVSSIYIFLRQTATWTHAVTGLEPGDEAIAGLNPISRVSSEFPQTFLVHGDADRDVPISESLRFAEALTEVDVANEVLVVRGAGHELSDVDPTTVSGAHAAAEAFIRKILGIN